MVDIKKCLIKEGRIKATLSDKIWFGKVFRRKASESNHYVDVMTTKDVKQFIKDLKEIKMVDCKDNVYQKLVNESFDKAIDKLAGSKLT